MDLILSPYFAEGIHRSRQKLLDNADDTMRCYKSPMFPQRIHNAVLRRLEDLKLQVKAR